MQNLEIYGYGIKGFILSMLETGLEISDKQLSAECVDQIISLGKQQLTHPVELVDGVKETLRALFPRYKLVMATKGDLLDQERKLKLSGLKDFFCHVEIMSDKTEDAYQKLLTDLDAVPENIMMIGNSMKSDILPVLKLGGYAGYVPFYTTWIHEVVSDEVDHPKLTILESIKELKNLLL